MRGGSFLKGLHDSAGTDLGRYRTGASQYGDPANAILAVKHRVNGEVEMVDGMFTQVKGRMNTSKGTLLATAA